MQYPASEAYKRVVVLLLMTAYTFNAMDRSIISIVAQSMKLDLGLSDTELGLLGGTAFAFLYALGGVPIARLAERRNRVNIIAVAMTAWSGLSALCGAAANFSQLLLIRVGVGCAESGCSPPAHSLISDYYEPSRRTSALSLYSCGTSLGYLLAAVAGGYVAQHWGWRAACAMVGLPGLVIAALIKALIREPPRGRTEPAAAFADGAAVTIPAAPPFSLRAEWSELRAVGSALLVDRPVLHMVLGVTLGGFAAYGFYAFVPPYFSRAFGLDYATIGVIAGLAGGAAVGMGILAGGYIADALARRDARWYALVPGIGGIIALPFYVLAVTVSDWKSAAWLLGVAGFFQYVSLGPTFGVVQNMVGPRRRATATALLYIICLNVFALGGGPLFTGWVNRRLRAARLPVSQYREWARRGWPSFEVSCPGGAAPAKGSCTLRCQMPVKRRWIAQQDAARDASDAAVLSAGHPCTTLLASAGISKRS
jgi:MFS family permease